MNIAATNYGMILIWKDCNGFWWNTLAE